MFFLFLESLGTTELLVILIVALVLFGPRKLPELSRSLGKSLNEFKRAGDDFKRTWEREVALENIEREAAIDRAMVAEAPATEEDGAGALANASDAAAPQAPRDLAEAIYAPVQGANVARGARFDAPAASNTEQAMPLPEASEESTAEPPSSRKTDWL